MLTPTSPRRDRGPQQQNREQEMRNCRMIGCMVVLAALIAPSAGIAQEHIPERVRELMRKYPPVSGMVRTEEGEWRAPTVDDALRALRGEADRLGVGNPWNPIVAVLRQKFESRPAAELDALVEQLAAMRLAADPDSDLESSIRLALTLAAGPHDDLQGVPHAGAFDALVRVYETFAADALAQGGDDPFHELEGQAPYSSGRLSDALFDIYQADPPRRGTDYLLALFEASEQPEPCLGKHCNQGSMWCKAGDLLRQAGVRGGQLALAAPPLPREKGPDWLVPEDVAEVHHWLCVGGLLRTYW